MVRVREKVVREKVVMIMGNGNGKLVGSIGSKVA